jgi:hypothetical protein
MTAENRADITKLYLFHFFNSAALTVVTNYVFMDKIFLRMGLDMAQFGVIKGVGWFLPMTLNFLLSPLILRMNRDREIVSAAYALRVIIPFGLLALPSLSSDRTVLFYGSLAVLVSSQIFPIVANNSISVLCAATLPERRLGFHLGWIAGVWYLPCYLLAIPCAWYIDLHSGGGDREFYRAFFVVMLIMGCAQIPASWVILKMRRPVSSDHGDRVDFNHLLAPLFDPAFFSLLKIIFVFGTVTAMVQSFINPFLFQRGMSMTWISALAAGLGCGSLILRPLWGKALDHFGGRKITLVAVSGTVAGVLCLSGSDGTLIILYAAAAWNMSDGLFASGLGCSQQWLTFKLTDKRKTAVYMAAGTFATGCGYLTGSLFGGFTLDTLKCHFGGALTGYRMYFALCAALLALSLFLIRFPGSYSSGKR